MREFGDRGAEADEEEEEEEVESVLDTTDSRACLSKPRVLICLVHTDRAT